MKNFLMILCLTILTFSITGIANSATAVNLGTAGNFVILSQAGITTTPGTQIVGDIGVSPIASTAITGFGLVLDGSGTFSTSPLVTGKVYAADYAAPTPSMLGTAIGDMQTAYLAAAGQAPNVFELGSGEIGGMTLTPGVYNWTTGVTISNDVTLSGNGVWIFQIAGTLNIASGKNVILTGGAQAENIFWQVAGATTLGTYSMFNGNILAMTNIAIQTGAELNGRALAQTAVTLDANNIRQGGAGSTPQNIKGVEIRITPETFNVQRAGNSVTGHVITLPPLYTLKDIVRGEIISIGGIATSPSILGAAQGNGGVLKFSSAEFSTTAAQIVGPKAPRAVDVPIGVIVFFSDGMKSSVYYDYIDIINEGGKK